MINKLTIKVTIRLETFLMCVNWVIFRVAEVRCCTLLAIARSVPQTLLSYTILHNYVMLTPRTSNLLAKL